MVVEWDPEKARVNARKHGVSFADAVIALEDDRALTDRDLSPGEEERWVTIGPDGLGRVLVVVYTWRGENLPSFLRGMRRSGSGGGMRS